MAGTFKIYISAVDVEIETESGGFTEKVIPDDDDDYTEKEIAQRAGYEDYT
jgi:hypothetical protein